MNLVYSCVFFKKEYIQLLSLLLKSFISCNNNEKNIQYLIITSPDFELEIKQIFNKLEIDGDIFLLI